MTSTINLSNIQDDYIHGWHKNNAFGDCHILSTAIAEATKHSIGVIFDDNTGFPVHSFIILPTGLGFDGNGVAKQEDIVSIYKKADPSKNLFVEKYESDKGIKFLNLWSRVDMEYYESSLEELKTIIDMEPNLLNCLKENEFDLDSLLDFEYFYDDISNESVLDFLDKKVPQNKKKNKTFKI